MPRWRFASLLLCLTLCGCTVSDAPQKAAEPSSQAAVLQDTPLDTVTYLPESLIE